MLAWPASGCALASDRRKRCRPHADSSYSIPLKDQVTCHKERVHLLSRLSPTLILVLIASGACGPDPLDLCRTCADSCTAEVAPPRLAAIAGFARFYNLRSRRLRWQFTSASPQSERQPERADGVLLPVPLLRREKGRGPGTVVGGSRQRPVTEQPFWQSSMSGLKPCMCTSTGARRSHFSGSNR